MVFSSMLFLWIFLPLVLAAYYISPGKIRNGILVFFSLLFYAWGEPLYVFPYAVFRGGEFYRRNSD